jgi:hypothetical protein
MYAEGKKTPTYRLHHYSLLPIRYSRAQKVIPLSLISIQSMIIFDAFPNPNPNFLRTSITTGLRPENVQYLNRIT